MVSEVKVRLLGDASGPLGVWSKGDVVVLREKDARALLESGTAEVVKPPKPKRKKANG